MRDTMGIIMTGGADIKLNELTRARAVAAVPVAGRYRLIDFILSNMVNSGIVNVGVPTQAYYRSLMDHLGSGKEWDLNRKLHGLFILPPYVNKDSGDNYKGDIDLLNGIMDYIDRSTQKYVLLAGGNLIFNTTFDALQDFHIKKDADITILYNEESFAGGIPVRHVALLTDENGRVTDMEVSPHRVFSNKISMGIYFMEKEFLAYQIGRCISRGMHDFVMDVLVHNIEHYNIYACPFDGYVGRIDSLASYYYCNMRLLEPAVCDEIFNGPNRIYTKVKDQVPTIYGDNAQVSNSLIADGCVIDGKVENSIIFRGVQVAKAAVITNSIVMQDSQLQKNTDLEYVILDKSVVIRHGKRLIGQENYPVVIGKNVIV